MFGLGDFQIVAALAGCVGITLFGVVYGTVNWNRGSDPRMKRRRCAAGAAAGPGAA